MSFGVVTQFKCASVSDDEDDEVSSVLDDPFELAVSSVPGGWYASFRFLYHVLFLSSMKPLFC